MVISNTTISNNLTHSSPETGEGLTNWYGQVSIANGTIIANGQLGIYSNGASGNISIKNTIIAGHTAADCTTDRNGGVVSSLGYNLIQKNSGCNLVSTDITGVDPKLGPLQGVPSYQPLLEGSPAAGGGEASGCTDAEGNPLTSDERGMPRVGSCDIGAYGLHPLGFSSLTVDTPTTMVGDVRTWTLKLQPKGAADVSNTQVTDMLPAELTFVANSLTATGGTPGYGSGVINWNGTVPAAGGVSIVFQTTVNAPLEPGYSVQNSAILDGGGGSTSESGAVYVAGSICSPTKSLNNPVLAGDAPYDSGGVFLPTVLKEGGSYRMWYTGVGNDDVERIAYATSPDGVTWTKQGVVLSPDQNWEGSAVSAPSVIKDGGAYKLWYDGRDSNGVTRIGYAHSADGVHWTKNGNWVLAPSGSWDAAYVAAPSVLKVNSTFNMWYSGSDKTTSRIGHATSVDGVTWYVDPANPVLDIGAPGSWEWLHVSSPRVLALRSEYFMWYSGSSLPTSAEIGLATSTDLRNWTRQGKVIPRGTAGSFDAYRVANAAVLVDGTQFKIWYSAMDASSAYTLGYATADYVYPGECQSAPPPPASPTVQYLPYLVRNAQVPNCPSYYSDAFEDPSSGWPVSNDAYATFAYVAGQYQIKMKKAGYWTAASPGAKASDYVASVTAHRQSGKTGSYGLIFGINSDWTEFYALFVYASRYSLWRYGNSQWTALKNWTTSKAIATGTKSNRLKVVRSGSTIAVYVNDKALTTINDNLYTGLRRIGLLSSAPSTGPIDARFDDFSLYPASCGPIATAPLRGPSQFELGKPGTFRRPLPSQLIPQEISGGGSESSLEQTEVAEAQASTSAKAPGPMTSTIIAYNPGSNAANAVLHIYDSTGKEAYSASKLIAAHGVVNVALPVNLPYAFLGTGMVTATSRIETSVVDANAANTARTSDPSAPAAGASLTFPVSATWATPCSRPSFQFRTPISPPPRPSSSTITINRATKSMDPP